ncbi:MAG: NAD-dependent epimerase/dehydratase family protein [Lachnospiraceae bacterium]|nr:NAD-dependent epimerase/dehydratase family protein [Lachnospiraceae bacterium]
MKKILITGAGSFIGTSFENYIKNHPKRADYEISVMDTFTGRVVKKDAESDKSKDAKAEAKTDSGSSAKSDADSNAGDAVKKDDVSCTINGTDIKEAEAWNFKGYDVIFHVAGIAHADVGKVSEEGKELYRKVNTELTVETAKKAKEAGVKQFIFMSSAIVYGASSKIGERKEITKDTKPSPENFYGESKLNAEIGLKELDDDNFRVVILRPPMIYGPGCKGNYNSLRKFAIKLPLFPKVKNERSMLFTDNLCEFVRLMTDNEERGIFHPANKEKSNTSEMVKMIASAHGKNLKLVGGFTWLLKILSAFTGLVNKAFGSLTYADEITRYKDDYNVTGLEESIILTEKCMTGNEQLNRR